jgi:adenylate cyclase
MRVLRYSQDRQSASAPTARAVRRHLEHLLRSRDFDAPRRSRDFLVFIVEETLSGNAENLTQLAIATCVFQRKDDFDPLVDPIVRIQAGRLRLSLERYYLLGGKHEDVRIELPKGSYVPVFRKVAEAEPEEVPLRLSIAAPAPSSWPSVAVRPLEGGVSGEVSEVARRFMDVLATELGRYRDVRVVVPTDAEPPGSHRPASRFELRGRLRPNNRGFSVTARLLDTTTGEQAWGDEYHAVPVPGPADGALDDVARVIAARVAAEHGVIVQALAGEYLRQPAAVVGPYAAILRSHRFFFARDFQDWLPAVLALKEAVAREPEIALAWAQLARLYMINHSFELSDIPTPIDEAIGYASQAVRLDPSSMRLRCFLASGLLIKGELQSGRDELDDVLRLNPGSLVYLEIIGYLLALLGDWERGIGLVRQAMDRNPHRLPYGYLALWADHLRKGELEEAYACALEYRDPTFFWRSLIRACSLGHLGRSSEATAAAAELLREKPSFEERGRVLIGYYIKPAELQEQVVDGLRKAGLTLR